MKLRSWLLQLAAILAPETPGAASIGGLNVVVQDACMPIYDAALEIDGKKGFRSGFYKQKRKAGGK